MNITEHNRRHVAQNKYQGTYERVLCCCSAGILRSATAAVVLAQEPYNCNTRSVGLERSFALTQCDDVLISWADTIVVMTEDHEQFLRMKFDMTDKMIVCLHIEDDYKYRDPALIDMIKDGWEHHKSMLDANEPTEEDGQE